MNRPKLWPGMEELRIRYNETITCVEGSVVIFNRGEYREVCIVADVTPDVTTRMHCKHAVQDHCISKAQLCGYEYDMAASQIHPVKITLFYKCSARHAFQRMVVDGKDLYQKPCFQLVQNVESADLCRVQDLSDNLRLQGMMPMTTNATTATTTTTTTATATTTATTTTTIPSKKPKTTAECATVIQSICRMHLVYQKYDWTLRMLEMLRVHGENPQLKKYFQQTLSKYLPIANHKFQIVKDSRFNAHTTIRIDRGLFHSMYMHDHMYYTPPDGIEALSTVHSVIARTLVTKYLTDPLYARTPDEFPFDPTAPPFKSFGIFKEGILVSMITVKTFFLMDGHPVFYIALLATHKDHLHQNFALTLLRSLKHVIPKGSVASFVTQPTSRFSGWNFWKEKVNKNDLFSLLLLMQLLAYDEDFKFDKDVHIGSRPLFLL
jgi:hypothetical protein